MTRPTPGLARMGRPVTLVALALLAAPPAAAQNRTPAAFRHAADSFLSETLAVMPAVPGLAVSVVRGDTTIYRGAFGWADVEAAERMTPRTPLYIASNTKPFVALAAALLHERGIVDLDSPVTTYLRRDWFPPQIDAGAVTLRHLLTHTSGLSNDPMVSRTAYSGEHTPHLLRTLLGKTTSRDGAPLGTFDYTNTGYLIASIALEEATGLPWQDIVEREIFAPLAMTGTTARRSRLANAGLMAAPYRATGIAQRVRIPLEKTDQTLHAAGGIISTLGDMERWLYAGMHAGRAGGSPRLPSAVIESTHTVQAPTSGTIGPLARDGYGLGWIVGSFAGQRLIYHIGNFPGTASFIAFMPEPELGVVVFVNEDEVGVRLALMVATFVYDWWTNEGRAAPQLAELRAGVVKRLEATAPPPPPVRLSEAEIRPLVGTYYSDAYGTLYVSGTAQGELEFRLGNQRGQATAYERGTASVPFLPGRADTWTFELEDGASRRVRYGEWGTFERLTRSSR